MRRWAKRLLIAVGALLLLIVLVAAGAIVFLQTGTGGRWLANQVVTRANENLSGQLGVGELDFSGDLLILKDVVLRDPEGEVVAQVEEVRVDLGPTALFGRTARVDSVKLLRPQLFVVQDAEGTNLQRALEPKVPKPEEPKKDGTLPVNIVVGAMAIEDGLVEYENTAGEAPLQLAMDDLSLTGAFSLLRDGEKLNATVEATSALMEPREGPVKLDASIEGDRNAKSFTVDLQLAGAVLQATARVAGESSENVQATVKRLELPPALARAFLPSWPLQTALIAEAEAKKAGGALEATVGINAGKGRIDAAANANLDLRRVDRLEVNAENLDLSQLVEEGPQSDLAFTLTARGGGSSAKSAWGELHLRAPQSALEGGTFGPVQVDLSVKDGVATLSELSAKLPGVALKASGTATQERIELSGRAAASDLKKLADTLGRLARPEGLPLAGEGALAFQVEGPLRSPAVAVSGDFPRLSYERNDVRGLRLRARVPNVRAPLASDASVSLKAERAVIAQKRWVRPHVSLQLDDRKLALRAGTSGDVRLEVSADGAVADDGEALALSRMTLRYPEATWKLERPALVAWGEGGVRVERFALRSGKQRIAVDANVAGESLTASIDVDRLALRRLPRDLIDPSLKLGGVVDAEVRARGRTSDPALDAKVRLVDVQVKAYRDINASLDASWKNGRAEGALSADALGVRAKGTFDLPVVALRTGGSGKVRAQLDVERMDVAEVFKNLGEKPPFTAVAQAKLELSGTARSPKLDASARLEDLVYEQLPPTDVALAVATDEGGRVGAKLTAQAAGEPSTIALGLPWTLGQLLRSPPTAKKAMRAPIELAVRMRDFPVPLPAGQAGLLPTPAPSTGGSGASAPNIALLNGDLTVKGPMLAPVGEGELTLSRTRLGDLPALAAALSLKLRPTENTIGFKVAQDDHEILDARVALRGALSRLMQPTAWTRMPFEAEARWGPVAIMELQQWMPAPEKPGEAAMPLLTGVSSGQLRASGTLGAPELELDTSVHGLGSTQFASAMGDVVMKYRYDDKKSAFTANLLSNAGGRMTMSAEVPLELSWRSMQRGLKWRRAPVKATLRAQGFDPTFLSGITPQLRRIGGRMEASVDVDGPLSLPSVRGRFEWHDGTLALAGNGSYEKIHVLVDGTDERLVVRDVTAWAGRGKAHLEATLTRDGETVSFDAKGNLSEFPVVSKDQLVATVSLNSTAQGTATIRRVHVPRLAISEAHVELPSEARKDIQQLEDPENVTFVWNGEPISDEEEEAAAQASGGGGSAGVEEREIEIGVEAPRNLWVKGEDMNVEVGFEPGFRVLMTGEPQLFGTVKLLRGHLAVLGRRFEFGEGSEVVFAGPATEPRLNITAIHENEREDVVVTLNVTGAGEDFELRPTSDPPLTETEIYTLIATGRRSLRPGSSSTSAGGNPATSLLGSLAASQLRRTLESALPVDVLNIQAGEKGVIGTRVEAGTYITNRLYLGIESQIGGDRERGENQNELKLEYDLSKRWMLDLEYGDAAEGQADLIWRKRY